MNNPFLNLSGLPRFDEFLPDHIVPAIERLIVEADAAVAAAEIVEPVEWDRLVLPLDDAIDRLSRAWGLVDHLQAVSSTPDLRRAYNTMLPEVSAFWTRLGQNPVLYAQYARLYEDGDSPELDPLRRRVLEYSLRNFRLGGVALSAEHKLRFAEVRKELSELSARFAENVLDATDDYELYLDGVEQLAGVPEDVVAASRESAQKEGRDGYRLTLQMPCLLPVLTHAEDRELRRKLYEANLGRASDLDAATRDNGPLIDRILALRGELAALLEFETYADYSLATKMAEHPTQVLEFLRDLGRHALPHARRDRRQLQAFARDELGIESLESWDLGYTSEKLKQSRYSFSQLEVKDYFTVPKVLGGLFDLIDSLYGVKIRSDQAPVWHDDVHFYRATGADGRLLGQFYLDLYAREGKRGGAWMDVCRNRRGGSGDDRTPLVHLVCNFGAGIDGRPATLNHADVVTLFHEMGHGLHQLLTEVDEPTLAGISGVEWDAVELPSQFMENFCWEWPRIQAMTAHVETGASLPYALYERMLAAKNYQSGLSTVRQLEFALFDMHLHYDYDTSNDSVLGLLERVRSEVAVNPSPKNDRFPHQFSHIFAGGYAAGYYSYKWAEVLSADAYAAFEEPSNAHSDTGARFRREVLARGGSRPAAENFRAFRGRDPDVSALLRHGGMSS